MSIFLFLLYLALSRKWIIYAFDSSAVSEKKRINERREKKEKINRIKITRRDKQCILLFEEADFDIEICF